MGFDYLGMSEAELARVCDDKLAQKGLIRSACLITDCYSMSSTYREYCGFPKALPLQICSDHGAGDLIARTHELDNDAACMFVFSDGKLEDYRRASTRPCYKVPHPFPLYRKIHGIRQIENPKGTLAYVAHSIPWLDCKFDIEEYADGLLAFPSEFQPVCVCLYYADVEKKLHLPFIRRHIPVYTAGAIFDVRFVQRHYEILRHFKYTTSNDPAGSSGFYSIEMGIPFFSFGCGVRYEIPPNMHPPSERDSSKTEEYRNKWAQRLFAERHDVVTAEQQEVVERIFNETGAVSPPEMRRILWKAYLKGDKRIHDVRRAVCQQISQAFSLTRSRGLWG